MSAPTTNQILRAVALALVCGAALLVWFSMGPIHLVAGRPGDAWWLLGPVFVRGPGWEDGSYLCFGPPEPVQVGLWSAHLLAGGLLRYLGLVRRWWPILVWPAALGQLATVAAFYSTFSAQL
ncbi:MAG: hypothetical protein RL398_1637 [Planctomycetota bacterium]|jgi:hypothetical protein